MFEVQGRKHSLMQVRKKMLEKHESFMRNMTDEKYASLSNADLVKTLKSYREYHTDETKKDMQNRLKSIERTRHLKLWHDQSTIANHSYLVFMVSCVYDSAVYYTNEEYNAKYHKKVDIQAAVETPEIYIIARCSGTDYEQLAYVETRLEDLHELNDKVKTKGGQEINDVMRFFHGDGPARQFESGQQKGGTFYCSVCGSNVHSVHEMDYILRSKMVSFQDKQKLLMKGVVSKKNSIDKVNAPLKNLTVHDLTRELTSRGIYEGETRKEKEKLLVEEMSGVQRVPALLYTAPMATLKSINCQDYEVLPFEPLHDIGKHIENILVELPAHLTAKEASIVSDIVDVSLGEKNTKRTFDYRCTIIKVAQHSRGKVAAKAQTLLDTLVEIQDIAYSTENSRTPRQILRLHNLVWHHAILCKEVIGFKLKKLTIRKFYGSYFHNITSHAPVQTRLVSGRSTNAEEQERVFNALKNISKATSSYQPDQIVGNMFIRLQAEEKLKGSCPPHFSSAGTKQQSDVSKLASALPSFPNTLFSSNFLKKHSRSWQAHLEKIADFLVVGEGVWWTRDSEGSIQFFDGIGNEEEHEEGPHVHHYRSSSFKQEERYLANCWQSCLSNNISLPLQELRIPDENGNMVHSQVSTSEVTLTVENILKVPEDSVKSTLSSPSTLSVDACDHLEKEENVVSFIEVRHDHESHTSDNESEPDQGTVNINKSGPEKIEYLH